LDKVVFTSQDLPAELDDKARFRLWHDMYVAAYCDFDLSRLEKPFSARTEIQQFGALGLASTVAGVDRLVRNKHQVAAATRSNFCLAFSRGEYPLAQTQLGREIVHEGESPMFVTEGAAGDIRQRGGFNFFLIDIPSERVLERVANAYDLVATALKAAPQASGHLKRYIETLRQLQGRPDPALGEHVEATLLDLIALILGAQGDSAEIARMRGLRAARLQEVLAAIRKGFADPLLSPARVALQLGVSPRYVNDLLQETGASFAERVMELRLQKARSMLGDRRHDRLKVIDIAFDCGFNDVSYFNRCFRRRFGTAPNGFRGSGLMPAGMPSFA
jgi:AraC-like DNA-binding protein